MASEDNNLSELERLIDEEKQDKARQNEIINGRNTKEKRKKITVISAVAATSIALIVGLIIYDPFTQSIRWESDPEPTPGYAGATGGAAPIQASDPFGWAKESGKIFPVPTKEWEEKSYLDSIQERSEKERIQKYSSTNLSSIASELPSEASGYTSDDSKAKNADGSDNYAYSYWTQEVFVNETSMMLERLLNPTYGSWKTYQYSSSMDGAYDVLSRIFSDLIDPDTLKSGSGVDSIPVLADWNRDDYGLGDQLLSYEEGNRWVGEVTDMSVTFSFNEETFQREAILVANVKYSAWTKSKETVTKDGVLTLNLGSNNEKKVASQNKIFIKSAKLEF